MDNDTTPGGDQARGMPDERVFRAERTLALMIQLLECERERPLPGGLGEDLLHHMAVSAHRDLAAVIPF